jgi:hypothetical protein
LCGQFGKGEVDKKVEEPVAAWTRIKKQLRDRELEFQQTFCKAYEF